jgi:hypothetical protein
MYFPRNWEFGSALSKLWNFGEGLNPPHPLGTPLVERDIALSFLGLGSRRGCGQHYVPAALPPGKTRYPLYRGLDGPQGRSGLTDTARAKLYNDQRIAQVFNLFVYLLLPYMFRAFFWPIVIGRCAISAVVQACWVWFQRLGADTIPSRLCVTLVIIQFHSKMHGPYNVKLHVRLSGREPGPSQVRSGSVTVS